MRNEESHELTAFGAWVNLQPKGVLTRAMRQTGLAWTTVNKARRKRVSRDAAELLAKFTRGAVKARDLVKPRVSRGPRVRAVREPRAASSR